MEKKIKALRAAVDEIIMAMEDLENQKTNTHILFLSDAALELQNLINGMDNE